MTDRRKLVVLVLAFVALAALVALTTGITSLDLKSGPLYLVPAVEQPTRQPFVGQAEEPATNYLTILTVAFIIILPLSLLYLLISPSARRRFLIQVVQVSVFVLVFYFLSKNIGRIFSGLNFRFSGGSDASPGSGGLELKFLEPFTPQYPNWLTEIISFALAIGFLYFLYRLWRRWRVPDDRLYSPANRLVRSAQTALRGIDTGQNLREVVLRCYHDMLQAVSERRHITRPDYLTPHEFIRSLQAAGLPAEQVQRLTSLFESVRYGHKIPGAQERAEAVSCLNTVVEKLGGET